jgi:hypothetical protein
MKLVENGISKGADFAESGIFQRGLNGSKKICPSSFWIIFGVFI